jgi:uncharacterized protein YjbI with pentapeptide repeats
MKYNITTAEELLRRYSAGERIFAGTYLEGDRCLDGANLSGANLSGSILNCSLIGADLTESLLIGTEIAESDLTDAIFRRARLKGADLSQSVLVNVDLTDANLSRAELEEAVMENVNLTGANLRKTSGVDVEYWLQNGCIFCRTTMPDGSIRNDHCSIRASR